MASTNIHVVHSEEAVIDVPDTGFETMLSQPTNNNTANGGIISYIPLVFVLVGIVLALSAFYISTKKKHDKKKGMNLNTKTRGQMTRAIYISAFAMAAVGVGGTVYLKNQASAATDDLNVVGDLYTTLVERDDISSIYCGTDNLKLSTANTQGYMIRMNGGVLLSTSNTDSIVSISDWGELTPGTWGFFTDYTQHGTESSEENSFVPLPQRNGVITNTIEVNSEEETVPVTFCARISNDTPEGEYVGVVSYEQTNYARNFMLPDSAMIDYNSKNDSDGDTIPDRKENQIGTSIISDDTDFDMVPDNKELYLYGTSPFTEDTDGDTVTDYSEIELGLNPNLQSTDGVTNDKDREMTYVYYDEESSVTLEMTGKGNLPEAYVEYDQPEVEGEDGTGNIHVYSFQTKGDLTEAEVTMPYDPAEMAQVDSDNLVFYNVNEEDGLTYEEDAAGHNKIEVNESNHTMTTTVKHFSEYTVGENDEEEGKLLGGISIKSIITKIKNIICKVLQTILPGIKCESGGSPEPEDPSVIADYNNDGVDDIVLADSGFDSNKNGFSFKNYPSQYTSGLCYGMAKFAEEYYTGKLEISRPDGNPSQLFPGYDFSRVPSFINSYNASQDLITLIPNETNKYVKQDLIMGSYMSNDAIGEAYMVNPTIFNTSIRAIMSLFTDQSVDTRHKSDSTGDLSAKEFVQSIIDRLNNQDPLTIGAQITNIDTFDFENYNPWLNPDYLPVAGGHAVNVTKLVRNGKNPNTYFVEFYDNNYPKEAFYFDLECNPMSNECRASDNHKVDKAGTPVYHIDSESPFIEIFDTLNGLPVTRVD